MFPFFYAQEKTDGLPAAGDRNQIARRACQMN